MKYLGIIGLLVVVAIAAMMVTSRMGPATTSEDGSTVNVYTDAVESAKSIADIVSEKSPTPTPTNVSGGVVIYDGISVAANSVSVDISGRGLTGSLKAEVRQLSNLKELNLSGNNFTGLPAEVGQLSKLETLNLSNNPFTGLPYELGNLKNLKVLDLRGTNYAEQDLEVIKKELPATVQILVN